MPLRNDDRCAPAVTETVVVIDDDTSLRDALESLMLSVDYRFQGFGCGEDFLSQKLPPQPFCLLLDVELPGMSGLELQLVVKKRRPYPPIPIVFLSGGDSDYATRALDAGALEFLHKPFDPDLLLENIRRALRQGVA